MNSSEQLHKLATSRAVRKATQLLRLFQNRMGPNTNGLTDEDKETWRQVNEACRDLGRLDPTPDRPCDADCLGCAGVLRDYQLEAVSVVPGGRVSVGYRGELGGTTHRGYEDYLLNAKGKTGDE